MAAPFAWMLSMEHERLRSSGLAAWMTLAVAWLIALFAWRRDRRWFVRLIATGSLVVGILFTYMFLVMLRLSPSPELAAMAKAPEISLPDHEGRPVKIPDSRVTGPTLVVFFRGHW